MADKSSIEWTDATWNPIVGCSIVSPACTNCYAMAMAARIESMAIGQAVKNNNIYERSHYAGTTQPSKAGPVWTGIISNAPDHILCKPMTWRTPRRVFVNSMSDLFHDGVPDWKIAEIYGLMIAAHHLRGHTFQWLTKRSARARKLLNDTGFWDEAQLTADQEILDRCDPLNRRKDDARATCDDYSPENPPPGIWAGVTTEDQPRADERIPDILATPAAKRFVSGEPLLGELDLISPLYKGEAGITMRGYLRDKAEPDDFHFHATKLDWVIAGGESGPKARPSHPDWFRSLRDQCAAAGVPFFFKQWGEWTEVDCPAPNDDGSNQDPYFAALVHAFAGDAKFVAMLPDGTRMSGKERVNSTPGGPSALHRVGKRAAGSLLDGREHKEFPQ